MNAKLRKSLDLIDQNKLSDARSFINDLLIDRSLSKEEEVTANLALSTIEMNSGNSIGAKQYVEKVLRNVPADARANLLMVGILCNERKPIEAYEYAKKVDIHNVSPAALNGYCQAIVSAGDYQRIDERNDLYEKIDKVNAWLLPNYLGAHSIRNRVFGAESLSRYLALQRKWGEYMMSEAEASPLTKLERDSGSRNHHKDGRVRLGFYALSDVFDTQAVLRPIIKHLDRTIFDVRLAFIENGSGVITDNDFTSLFEEVIVVPRGSNRDAAIKLAQMGCDIMVDLNGLQQPATRVGAMAWRVAPLQLSWTGRPITCGLPGLDYNIVDSTLAGDGSGTLNDTLELPGAFACFGRMPEFEIAEGLPSERSGQITFGINAEPAKFNLSTIDMWAETIKATNSSRAVFMRPEYSSPCLRENILREFIRHGVEKDRIEFWSDPSESRKHMQLYNEIDVLLDCYPMTGGIGMLEALHMGVPSVSLEGSAIQLRVGASHLHSVGLDDLRATSVSEYVAKATALVEDNERRRALRRSLRSTLSETAFTDIDKFAAGFNTAMKNLLEHPALKDWERQKQTKGAFMTDNDQKVTINGAEYSLSEMSSTAQEHVKNIQMAEQELQRLSIQTAITQTARSTYAQALKTELEGKRVDAE